MTTAKVKLWEQEVGYVSWNSRNKLAYFEYADTFVRSGQDIAPLTMPLSTARLKPAHIFAGDKDKLYRGLPPLLADSLPDKYGEILFAKWQQTINKGKKAFNPVERLCYISSRALGALEYEPAILPGMDEASVIQLDDLYQIAKKILFEKSSFSAKLDEHRLADLIKVGTSPGGKHPKVIIAIHPHTGEVRSGQCDAPEDFEHWLLKFDMDKTFPFGRVEYAYYKMAIDAKIDMSFSSLKEENGRAHFMTKRFDRVGNKKIHLQTLAALSPSSKSYDDIFSVMRKLKLPYVQHEQLFRRMVFNVIAKNIDDHSKNFSFLMQQDGNWSLSPAYDLLFTYSPTDPSFMNRHEFFINGKNDNITKSDLIATAEDNEINGAALIIEEVKDVVSNWRKYAAMARLDEPMIKLIEELIV